MQWCSDERWRHHALLAMTYALLSIRRKGLSSLRCWSHQLSFFCPQQGWLICGKFGLPLQVRRVQLSEEALRLPHPSTGTRLYYCLGLTKESLKELSIQTVLGLGMSRVGSYWWLLWLKSDHLSSCAGSSRQSNTSLIYRSSRVETTQRRWKLVPSKLWSCSLKYQLHQKVRSTTQCLRNQTILCISPLFDKNQSSKS